MARRAKGAEPVELAQLPDLSPQVAVTTTATEERRERELEEVLTELGTDTTIRVWRRGAEGAGKSAMCGQMSGDGFSLDALLETFGGGDYTLQIFQGRTLKEKVSVSLDPSVPAKNPRVKPLPPGQTVQQGTPSLDSITALIAAMGQMSMQTQQMMSQMMAANTQSTTGLITAFASMMATRQEKDPTELALRMSEVFRSNENKPGGASVTEMLALFEKGMNLGKTINGGDGDGVMPMIGTGVTALGQMVSAIVEEKKARTQLALANANRVPVARTALPATATVTVDASTAVEENSPTDDQTTDKSMQSNATDRPWVAATRPYVGSLLAASKFMPAAAAALTIEENLNDDELNDLLDDVYDETEPGFGARLVEYFPEARSVNPEWLGAVLATLVEEGDDEEANDEEAEATGASNAGGTAGDGGAGGGVTPIAT